MALPMWHDFLERIWHLAGIHPLAEYLQDEQSGKPPNLPTLSLYVVELLKRCQGSHISLSIDLERPISHLSQVSRLLATIFLLSTLCESFSLPLYTGKALSANYWAVYFHQASLGTYLHHQYLFGTRSKSKAFNSMAAESLYAVELLKRCQGSQISLSFHLERPISHLRQVSLSDILCSLLLQSPSVDDFDQREIFCLYLFPRNTKNRKVRYRSFIDGPPDYTMVNPSPRS